MSISQDFDRLAQEAGRFLDGEELIKCWEYIEWILSMAVTLSDIHPHPFRRGLLIYHAYTTPQGNVTRGNYDSRIGLTITQLLGIIADVHSFVDEQPLQDDHALQDFRFGIGSRHGGHQIFHRSAQANLAYYAYNPQELYLLAHPHRRVRGLYDRVTQICDLFEFTRRTTSFDISRSTYLEITLLIKFAIIVTLLNPKFDRSLSETQKNLLRRYRDEFADNLTKHVSLMSKGCFLWKVSARCLAQFTGQCVCAAACFSVSYLGYPVCQGICAVYGPLLQCVGINAFVGVTTALGFMGTVLAPLAGSLSWFSHSSFLARQISDVTHREALGVSVSTTNTWDVQAGECEPLSIEHLDGLLNDNCYICFAIGKEAGFAGRDRLGSHYIFVKFCLKPIKEGQRPHMICLSCAQDLLDRYRSDRRNLQCPVCKHEI